MTAAGAARQEPVDSRGGTAGAGYTGVVTDHPRAGRSRRRVVIAVGVLVSAAIAVAAATGAIVAKSRGGGHDNRTAAVLHGSAGNATRDQAPAELPDLPLPVSSGGGKPSPVAVPGVAGGSTVNVPVLLYHYIRVVRNACDSLGMSLSVTPTVFNQQLTLLQVGGYHVISLDTLMQAVLHGGPLPTHPVVLTFDDGYADFATAAIPILLAHQMTATDFVVPGFLGRRSYMTTEQVQLAQSQGMSIGAHTMHHVALAHVSATSAESEIANSRAYLQELLGVPVTDFAYPYGDFNGAVELLVLKAGFRDGFTTQSGMRQSAPLRFALPRVRVGNGLGYFASELGIPGVALTAAAASPTPLPAGEDAGNPASASACGSHGATTPPPRHTPAASPVVARLAVSRLSMVSS
jgi:peptidoglycan/xylan/chitin deacetylase (PgdA/CDA1 family)